LQAAVGVAQMERFDQIIKSKQTIFDFYNKKFMGKKGILQLPINSPNITNSSWLYTLILDEYINRDSLINKLKDSGIDSRPSFNSLCDMPPYKGFTHSKVLKNSQLLSSQGISLPSSSSIKNIELEYIANIFLDEVASIQKNNINCKE
jgi:perosamine synthetase